MAKLKIMTSERIKEIQDQTAYPDIEIQKKNPTLLYYPNSLDF